MIEILLSFSTYSDAQMIFLVGIMFATLTASVRMFSPLAIVTWALSMIALIGVMEFNLELIYFWFTLILNVLGLSIGLSVRSMYS